MFRVTQKVVNLDLFILISKVCCCLEQWFPPGRVLSPREHLAKSRNNFGLQNLVYGEDTGM